MPVLVIVLPLSAPPTVETIVMSGATAWPASGPGIVQVTSWPTWPHVHPVPLADLKVRPAGSESVTVTTPVVGAPPTFSTWRV